MASPKTKIRIPNVEEAVNLRDLPKDLQNSVVSSISTPQNWHQLDIAEAYRKADPGARLAARRILRKLTQAQLAELANVSQSEVSRAEERIENVKWGTINQIASALGTTGLEIVRPSPDLQLSDLLPTESLES